MTVPQCGQRYPSAEPKSYGSSILAELAISQIVLERQKAKEKAAAESYSPRRVCHIIDSIKNQEELDILQLVYRDMVYFVGVYAPLPARVKSLEREGILRAHLMARRFRDELGYIHARPYAIHNKKRHGRTMYHMIHATDHDEAAKLMLRAYRKVSGREDLDLSNAQVDMEELWREAEGEAT